MAMVAIGQPEQFNDAVSSALFYLVGYAFTSFGAWSVVIALEKAEGKGLDLDDYAGLGRKYPALAAAMLVFMLSLTGVPPTLGFFAKFYLFRTVIAADFIGLAMVGILTSLISAYYYLRVIVIMYMREGQPEASREPWLQVTTGVAAVGTVVLGLFAQPLLNWASQAIMYLF
jgi:NADH-quinone oxidoreductase subunit N